MATRYIITGETNGWIARRDTHRFRGKTDMVVSEHNTQREAQIALLDMYNHDYEAAWRNRGLAVSHSNTKAWSHSGGTRGYGYDSRYYRIEEAEG